MSKTPERSDQKQSICPICGKPCPLEECVIDAKGRAVHKDCYRTALIEGRESL
jgi:hypothetical protein